LISYILQAFSQRTGDTIEVFATEAPNKLIAAYYRPASSSGTGGVIGAWADSSMAGVRGQQQMEEIIGQSQIFRHFGKTRHHQKRVKIFQVIVLLLFLSASPTEIW
jgi:hypothetical protein